MPRNAPKLTPQQLKAISEYFNWLDDDKDGKLDAEQVSVLYRALGQTISEQQLSELIQRAMEAAADSEQTAAEPKQGDPQTKSPASSLKQTKSPLKRSSSRGGKGSMVLPPGPGLTAEQFLTLFINNYKQPTSEGLLLQCFEIFDGDRSGRISTEKLREILTTRGEKMAHDEVDEILRLAGATSGGSFDYAQLVRKLIEGPQKIRSV